MPLWVFRLDELFRQYVSRGVPQLPVPPALCVVPIVTTASLILVSRFFCACSLMNVSRAISFSGLSRLESRSYRLPLPLEIMSVNIRIFSNSGLPPVHNRAQSQHHHRQNQNLSHNRLFSDGNACNLSGTAAFL